MLMQNSRTQKFARFLFPILLVFALLAAPGAALPDDEPLETSAFSKWELSNNGKDFFLRATCLNNHAILLQFANTFERKIADISKTFAISLEPVDRDLFKFDEGDYEICEVFVDGIGYQARASRAGSAIAISDPGLFKSLLASAHAQFVISFPELALSYTFPLEGLKKAFNRVKYLHLQKELEENAIAMKIFSNAGSIAILLAAAGATGWFLLRRKKISGSGQSKAGERTDGGENTGAKKQTKKSGPTFGTGKTSRERRASFTYKKNEYQDFGKKTRDDFYDRANFGDPFGGRPAGAPQEVRKAFEFFGLPENASLAEIRDERTFLLKACHPDRFQGDENAMKKAEEQTKKINYNFDILARYYKKS